MDSSTDRHAGWLTVYNEIGSSRRSLDEASAAVLIAEFERLDGAASPFCVGAGRSGLIAAMFANRLVHLGFKSHCVGAPTTPPIRRGDLLVAVSASGETRTTVLQARQARAVGARIVAVTGNTRSSLGELSNSTIAIDPPMSAQYGGTLFEQLALVALDGLVVDMMRSFGLSATDLDHNHTNLE